jgi:hypothetical protein
MLFPKLLSSSNALNGMKKRQNGYNLATTGMLPNFGKNAAAPAASMAQTTSVSLASTVLDSVSVWLKKFSAAAKRVLLKPEEPQPFAQKEQKSYQVFRRLSAQDEVRHVASPTSSRVEPAAEVFTDDQQLGQRIKPTLWDKFAKTWTRDTTQSAPAQSAPLPIDIPESDAPVRHANVFSATCPGKREANPIADAFEQRMAEKKAAAPVAPAAPKITAPVLNTAAKAEVKQSVPSKLRAAIFGRKQKTAQPAVQGEFALDNVRPIRNDLSDADLEVVSSVAKMVGKGNLQTATDEKAQSTAPSRRAPKSDSAINSAAETPQAEATPELIARV